MIVEFDQSFSKSIERLKNRELKERIKKIILKFETSHSLSENPSVKEMKGHPGFYRFRVGDYRVGFELISPNKILLILVAHRKDIYKKFP
jgi:mRNA interferase RelE/StbE